MRHSLIRAIKTKTLASISYLCSAVIIKAPVPFVHIQQLFTRDHSLEPNHHHREGKERKGKKKKKR